VVVSSVQSSGFVTVFPHGGARPTASNQNFFLPAPTKVCPRRPTRANPCKLVQGPSVDSFSTIVFAKIGDGGVVDFYVHGSVVLYCEILGYMAPGSAGGAYLTPVSPFRLYDSREPSYAPLGGVAMSQNEQRTLTVPSIPPNTPAVFLDVVATSVTGSGFLMLSAGPCGSSPASVHAVAFNPTRVAIANFNLVGLQNNQFCVTSTAPGTAHVVIDAAAYLQPTPSKVFTQIAPTRLYDTRDNSGAFRDGLGPLIAHVSRPLNVGAAGVPGGATGVVVTLTVTETTGPVSILSLLPPCCNRLTCISQGFLTAYPCGQPVPTASVINYNPSDTRPNTIIVAISAALELCVYAHVDTQLVVDVSGYF
jgi:hypothetical protein